MLLSNLVINKDEPIYIQIKRYISNMILKGLIPNNSSYLLQENLAKF